MKEQPQESNYRYILIDTPEKKQKYAPKQENDEYLSHLKQWNQVPYVSKMFNKNDTYRRPIKPPAGYEIVPEKEARLFKGQEQDGISIEMSSGWCKVQRPIWNGMSTFIRKIKTTEQSFSTAIEELDELQNQLRPLTENPWHSIDDLSELPENGSIKVEIFHKGHDRIAIMSFSDPKENLKAYAVDFTHWRLHIPPPEKKVVDEVKECYNAWFNHTNHLQKDDREVIIFALNWAKEHGGKE